jgi:hypothetical protein
LLLALLVDQMAAVHPVEAEAAVEAEEYSLRAPLLRSINLEV